jgi:Ca2+-binding EF-hand superfamily protein
MDRSGLRFAWGSVCLALVQVACGAEPPPADSRQQNTALFERLDVNHDGQVSRSEIPADKVSLFERLLASSDRDKSGWLSRDEFLAGLETRRPRRAADEKLPAEFGGLPGPEAEEEIFRRLDQNQDGKIAPDEVPDEGRTRFDRLTALGDQDGDGAISREELRQALSRVRQQFAGKPGDVEPEKVFEYLDRNADGKLTKDEVPTERQGMFERAVRFGDRDGDGALTLKEFARVAAMRKKRQERPAAADPASATPAGSPEAKTSARGGRWRYHLARLDSDHDGKVNLAEFSQQGKHRFSRLDKNQDGHLDSDEIQQAVAAHAVKTGVLKPTGVAKDANP